MITEGTRLPVEYTSDRAFWPTVNRLIEVLAGSESWGIPSECDCNCNFTWTRCNALVAGALQDELNHRGDNV